MGKNDYDRIDSTHFLVALVKSGSGKDAEKQDTKSGRLKTCFGKTVYGGSNSNSTDEMKI